MIFKAKGAVEIILRAVWRAANLEQSWGRL